jgi:hypothetical protein
MYSRGWNCAWFGHNTAPRVSNGSGTSVTHCASSPVSRAAAASFFSSATYFRFSV